MKTILISTFANISSTSNSRMLTIFNHVAGDKLVITTDFNHSKKKYYEASEIQHKNQVNLHVPAYRKNISFSRIWSHFVFAMKVKKFLASLDEKPNVIYCTMPTSSSAYICARFCKKHKIKFIIDIIDLWPDSLLPLVKWKCVIKILLSPWIYLTRYAYRYADVIMGESVKYANEAKNFNKKAEVYPIYLGVDIQYIDKVKKYHDIYLNKSANEIWIAYAGSLGNSYDFQELLNAVKLIHGRYRYKLWFIGDGVLHNEIESYIKKNKLNAEITGFVSYEHLLGYLSYCDIAVNIFKNKTKVVYSYKFNDYVAMDCFVLNSLEGETAQMINEYRIGKNFNFSNNPLANVLEDVLKNWKEYSSWKGNNRRLIQEKLDKEQIYSIVPQIFENE